MSQSAMTIWRTTDLEAVEDPPTMAEAAALWAEQADKVLVGVARTYRGLITQADLAAQVQELSGIRTRSNARTWLGDVLLAVAAADIEQGRPMLASLVLHQTEGTVGEIWDEVRRLGGQEPISDGLAREKDAAAARYACYIWAGATLPADKGRPALSERYEGRVSRERKKARDEAMPNVCPTCFMSIPPTGRCDNCG